MKSGKKPIIQIILGSTRQGRFSEKIYNALKPMLNKRDDTVIQLIDLKDYNIPFLNDSIPPAMQEKINDPIIQRWSDKIKEGDAYIIIVPEYNSGYPGVLKNALDVLYKEWNNKPVAFIGYSGGTSGGTNSTKQLRQVTLALKMLPIENEINIPTDWKAFDQDGNLLDKNIEPNLNKIIDQLIV